MFLKKDFGNKIIKGDKKMKLESGKFTVMPIEKYEELIKRITDLEKEIENLKNARE